MATARQRCGRVLEVHWRFTIALLRLVGMLGCSGWPLSWSRAWTRYAYFSMVVSVIVRATTILVLVKALFGITSSSDTLLFIHTLFLFNLLVKNLGMTLTQVGMVRRSRGLSLSLLVSAVLRYSQTFPGPRRKYAVRNVAVLCFGTAPLLYIAVCVNYSVSPSAWVNSLYVLNDLAPVVLVCVTQDSFIHVVAASVGHLAAIADGLHETMRAVPRDARSALCSRPCDHCHCEKPSAPGEQGEQGEQDIAELLRALRVRYQRVHDVVVATNRLYGLFNLVSVTVTIIEGVVCLYVGMNATMTFADATIVDANSFWTLAWGIVFTAKLAFICLYGEQMNVEIREFIHQIQSQEIRFGAFDIIYYDLTTLTRIIASMATYMVVLAQFSVILLQSRRRGLRTAHSVYTSSKNN